MVGKQVRGKYTQEYKAEAVRQAEASQSLAVLCWSVGADRKLSHF